MGACSACRVADANRLVLDEGGGSPWNVIAFVLSGAWPEVENGPSEKRVNDGLLEGGDDAGMDGGVHQSILDGVEALGEGVVVSREVHVARHGKRRLVRLSGR